MVNRLQIPLALVAGVILVAVISVAVLAWDAEHRASPAGQAGQTSVQQLEARSLNLTVVNPGAPCPVTAGDTQVPRAALAGFTWSQASGFPGPDGSGKYWDMFAVTAAGQNGPVLLRGRDLSTGHDLIFVGKWSYGPVVGRDPTNAQGWVQHSELFLDPNQPTHESGGAGLGKWSFIAGVAGGGPTYCIGLQLDGAGFTRTVVLAG